MHLSGESIEWLRRRCNADAAQDDLERTYAFPHALNARRTLKRDQVCPKTEAIYYWWVEFQSPNNENVLAYPLSRKLYPDHQLASRAGATANVAVNAVFRVVDQFKRQDFARGVYRAEADLYKKWKVAEIQLNAIDDGCVVWIKKFGFEPKDPEVLEEDYPTWARMNNLEPTVPARAADYPDAFLRSRQELHVYKVIR